ncbi:MAG: alanine racemase [Actinomycetota bacterium]
MARGRARRGGDRAARRRDRGTGPRALRGAALTPTVHTPAGVAALADAARALGGRFPVHLKVDTGMHRIGVWPPSSAAELAATIVDAGLELDGVFTHLASADADEAFTATQLARFREALDGITARVGRPRVVHAANSAATRRLPDATFDLVRAGIALYGLDAGDDLAADLRPALTLRTRVTALRRLDAGEAVSYGQEYRLARPGTIATLPVGYADGYPRRVWPGAEVLIGGRRFPVAGRVTMDQVLVDCGDAAVAEGDEAVLLGAQGDERIRAEDLARLVGTIPYEIVTGISARVPREYA